MGRMGLSGRGTNRTQSSQGKKKLGSCEALWAAQQDGVGRQAQTLEDGFRLRAESTGSGLPNIEYQNNWGQGVESMKQELKT